MNYKESKLILRQIRKAKNILVNCHSGADPDSIGSASSLSYVISGMGGKVSIGAPETVSSAYDFLLGKNKISTVDFNSNTLNNFDLLFMLDSEHWGRVFRTEAPKHIQVINLDHHFNNSINGNINIIDKDASSTSEMLVLLFSDFKINIDRVLASRLLAGIYSDTGFFQYANTTARSCNIAGKLIEKGADFNSVVLNLKRKRDINIIKLWGHIALNARVDKTNKFAWSAIPYEIYSKYKTDGISPNSEATDYFLRVIDGVNFAIGMVEKEPRKLHLSLRARVTGVDVSKIARQLNGGGHKDASGGAVHGLDFDQAVDKVLQVSRKYAKSAAK